MEKAVVPYRFVKAHDIGAEVRTDEHWHSLTHCSGKLTMQDVEAMAREFCLQKACGGSDKGCMIAALNVVGIEVE